MTQVNKVNARKEFFRVSLAELKQEIRSLGIDAIWTLRAEATQYRESLLLEDEMMKDGNKAAAWVHAQDELVNEFEDEAESILIPAPAPIATPTAPYGTLF